MRHETQSAARHDVLRWQLSQQNGRQAAAPAPSNDGGLADEYSDLKEVYNALVAERRRLVKAARDYRDDLRKSGGFTDNAAFTAAREIIEIQKQAEEILEIMKLVADGRANEL